MKVLLGLMLMVVSSFGVTLNIKTGYGAVGNGTTNDTTAVTNAVNACNSGDVVYAPPGNYLIDMITISGTKLGCVWDGVLGQSIYTARTNGAQAMFYFPSWNQDNIFRNLYFDMANKASSAIKYDFATTGITITYCLFKNGGNPAAIFTPGGSSATYPNGSPAPYTDFNHNYFQNIYIGINSFNKNSHQKINFNYFDTFYQGISAGGCKHDDPPGTDLFNDDNVFTGGQRMGIEYCGRFDDISISRNYFVNWRASPNPAGENYPGCSAQFPYMCDSFSISLATGSNNATIASNLSYKQPGTSWDLEYVVNHSPLSHATNNVLWNGGRLLVDESCVHVDGPTNCADSRVGITGNIGCGGNISQNTADFSNYPASNHYYSSCTNVAVAPQVPIPAPPFNPATGQLPGQTPVIVTKAIVSW